MIRTAWNYSADTSGEKKFAIFFDFLFSAGGLVLEMYSFGILRGFVAQYLELKILVFLMEAFSKKNEEKGVGVKKKIVL